MYPLIHIIHACTNTHHTCTHAHNHKQKYTHIKNKRSYSHLSYSHSFSIPISFSNLIPIPMDIPREMGIQHFPFPCTFLIMVQCRKQLCFCDSNILYPGKNLLCTLVQFVNDRAPMVIKLCSVHHDTNELPTTA